MFRASRTLLAAAALCGGCSALRKSSVQDDQDVSLDAVRSGAYSERLAESFLHVQAKLTQDMYLTWQKGTRPISTLIVSTVANTPEAVENFERNFKKLYSPNTFGDRFLAALFHSDGNNSHWVAKDWYKGVVVYDHVGPACRAEAWYKLDADLVKKFDFMWLLDNDFRMDYFNWDMYRTVLSTLRPMVSQPAIVPGHVGGPTAETELLQMRGRGKDGFLPLAREVPVTGSRAAFVSTVLFDSLKTRLHRTDSRKTSWCMPDVWDAAALLMNAACHMTAPVVVDMSPLRRIHDADLPVAINNDDYGVCMGAQLDPCPSLPFDEAVALRQAIKPFCALSDPMPMLHQQPGEPKRLRVRHNIPEAFMWASKDEGVVEKRPSVDFPRRRKVEKPLE